MPYFDMHCHLDFASNVAEAVRDLEALGAGAFSVGVLPAEQRPVPSSAFVKWGAGLHPWWLADGRAGKAELDALVAAIPSRVYVGEVGLDFGKPHGLAREDQIAAFRALAQACGAEGGRVLSVHAVHAADEALDILEHFGVLGTCSCIFHWYSGSSEAFTRAVGAGCFFSVGAPMLRSKRGREYARQIPVSQLLLETDMPAEGSVYRVDVMQEELAQTCSSIAELRAVDAAELAHHIEQTSRRLLALEHKS